MRRLIRLIGHMLFGVLFGVMVGAFVLMGTHHHSPEVELGLFAIGGAIFGLAIELGRRAE